MSTETQPRILIIRCGAMGDTVLATTVIDPILERWPGARIEWLATPLASALFAKDPRIARVHPLKHRKLPIWLSPIKRQLIRESRKQPFDLILNLETADFFRDLARRINTKQLIGYGDGATYTNRHNVENHRDVLRAAGLSADEAHPRLIGDDLPPNLPATFVVLHPGNSHTGAKNRVNIRAWPTERWTELNQRLQAAGVTTMISGTPNELEIAAQVASSDTQNLAGKTSLPAMTALMEAAQLLVCTDTGPVHIAAAVGTPVLGLYGPTNPTNTAPYAVNSEVHLIHHDLDCSPCYGTPRNKTCTDNVCMQAISVDEVFDEVLKRVQPAS